MMKPLETHLNRTEVTTDDARFMKLRVGKFRSHEHFIINMPSERELARPDPLPNKNKDVRAETETNEGTVAQSGCLTLCSCVQLTKYDFADLLNNLNSTYWYAL
jgi:hypothetical protein